MFEVFIITVQPFNGEEKQLGAFVFPSGKTLSSPSTFIAFQRLFDRLFRYTGRTIRIPHLKYIRGSHTGSSPNGIADR